MQLIKLCATHIGESDFIELATVTVVKKGSLCRVCRKISYEKNKTSILKKQRIRSKEYHAKNLEKRALYAKKYRAENREKIKKYQKNWQQGVGKAKFKAARKKYRENKVVTEEQQKAINEYNRRYYRLRKQRDLNK